MVYIYTQNSAGEYVQSSEGGYAYFRINGGASGGYVGQSSGQSSGSFSDPYPSTDAGIEITVYPRSGFILKKIESNPSIVIHSSSNGNYLSGEIPNSSSQTNTIKIYFDIADDMWLAHAATQNFQGSGTSADDPYLITSEEMLAKIAAEAKAGENFSGKYFLQTKDLDMSAYKWQKVVVGNGTQMGNWFCGVYDGGNHIVSGLMGEGLFGTVNAPFELKNLTLKDSIIYNSCSFTAGCYANGTITNCHSNATIIVNDGNPVAGICYGAGQIGITCTDCSFSGTITGNASMAAGIECYNGRITNCQNSGSIISTNTSSVVAGIVGQVGSGGAAVSIDRCIAKGILIGAKVSGILSMVGYTGRLTNCAVYGVIVASDKANSATICAALKYGDNSPQSLQLTSCSADVICDAKIGDFVSDNYYANLTLDSCYSKTNFSKYVSDGEFSDFAVVQNMNKALPMQTELFSVAISDGTNVRQYLTSTLGFAQFEI